MAKYTSSITSSITNKMGGAVFSNTGPHRILRSFASPSRKQSALTRLTSVAPQQGLAAYNSNTGTQWTMWALFTAWCYENKTGTLPVYHSPYTTWQQSFYNAQRIGAPMPPEGTATNPTPPLAVAPPFVTVSGGNLVVQPEYYTGPGAQGPWLAYLAPSPNGGFASPASLRYAYACGGQNHLAASATNSYANAFGQLPKVGDYVGVRVVGLWPDFWASYSEWTGLVEVFV